MLEARPEHGVGFASKCVRRATCVLAECLCRCACNVSDAIARPVYSAALPVPSSLAWAAANIAARAGLNPEGAASLFLGFVGFGFGVAPDFSSSGSCFFGFFAGGSSATVANFAV